MSQVHQCNVDQNKQKLYLFDLEFRTIHNFFRVTTSYIDYTKDTNSDIISLHIYNNSPYKITLPLALLGYCETKTTIHPTEKKGFRANILKLLDTCQSTILIEEFCLNDIKNNSQRNADYFRKTHFFEATFQISKYTNEQQKFLILFSLQHSQLNEQEFDQLAELLLKNLMVFATSKFET